MYTSLQVSHTEGLNTDQRDLVTELDAEVCTREMLGVLIHMLQDIDGPLAKNKDFVTRGRQVFTFLCERGIDFFDGADFMRWNNAEWTRALRHLHKQEHDIDAGMISSSHPHLAYIGKPFVEDRIAKSAGTSPNILPILQSELPEFDFDQHTLDTRSSIARIGDFFHITSHPLVTSQHSYYTRFVRGHLVPRAEEVVASSVAAEGNHMLKRWMQICASKKNSSAKVITDVFFREVIGMRTDREDLFATIRSVDVHVANERAMNPKVRAADVDGVVDAIKTALQGAWKHKHRAGQEWAASQGGKSWL